MFLYALIACELTVVYAVFWYLFLRKPKSAQRITGMTWGQYEERDLNEERTAGSGLWMVDHEESGVRQFFDYVAGKPHTKKPVETLKPFMVPVPREYELDPRRSRYVPAVKPSRSGIASWFSLWEEVDEKLSVLNVRP